MLPEVLDSEEGGDQLSGEFVHDQDFVARFLVLAVTRGRHGRLRAIIEVKDADEHVCTEKRDDQSDSIGRSRKVAPVCFFRMFIYVVLDDVDR